MPISSTTLATGGLTAVAALHLPRATGSPWLLADAGDLAGTVAGRRGGVGPPPPAACRGAAALLGTATAPASPAVTR